VEGINTIDGKFKQIIGRVKRRGADFWEFSELNVDVINARSASGLGLYDDSGAPSGIFIEDGGNVTINPELTVGTIKGKNRAKQYFYAGF
jgi:hypothetical protein